MDYHAFTNCVDVSAKWGYLSEFAVTHYPSIGSKFAPKQQVLLFSSEGCSFRFSGIIRWDAGKHYFRVFHHPSIETDFICSKQIARYVWRYPKSFRLLQTLALAEG